MSEEGVNGSPSNDEIPQELRDFIGQFDSKPLTESERAEMLKELGDGKMIVYGGLGLFVVSN